MSVLVSKQAPDFTAAAVMPDGSINDHYHFSEATQDKYKLIFFYPLDFTFVCPSELIALDHRVKAFTDRGVEVIAVSIDSQFTHHAWRNTPVDKGGIGPVNYTLVADVTHDICRAYGIEHPEAKVAFRGTFVIDQFNVVRAQIVNDLPIGRNLDEIVRLFDALQFHEKHGEVCPVNWKAGDEGMVATSEGVASYLKTHEENL